MRLVTSGKARSDNLRCEGEEITCVDCAGAVLERIQLVHSTKLIVAGTGNKWGASCQRECTSGAKSGKDLLLQTRNLSGSRIVLLRVRCDVRDIVTVYTEIGRAPLGDVGHDFTKSLIRARVLGAQAS